MTTCKNDSKPVVAKGLCQKCYDRDRSSKRDYKKDSCRNGHKYEEGSFKLSESGKRICLVCQQEGKKTHCPQGHEYTEENTYWYKGFRACRICRKDNVYAAREPGVGQGGINKAKTHCPKGHEYTVENTYTNPEGRRWCRTCARLNSKKQNIQAHGISVEKFTELLEAQEYKCLGCLTEINERSGQAVDHDHSCCPGRVSCGRCIRGILCKLCNAGLGFLKDDPGTLRRLADYLEK